MRRRERGSRVAYRDRRWGWSLLSFLFVFPVWLIVAQEGIDRRDRTLILVGAGGALASVMASFVLLRSNAFVIDRCEGTVLSSRLRFFWRVQKFKSLSQAKAVLIESRQVAHAVPPGGRGIEWIETVYRIAVEFDGWVMPFHDGISGAIGKRLAIRLAEDLGVGIRSESEWLSKRLRLRDWNSPRAA